MTCTSCGGPLQAGWRHCPACGARLTDERVERTHVLTVVVNDLQGSTALAERLDPETLRGVLDSYFDELGSVLEAHGGRIEKRIGDAMVTVFGLPRPARDDAARALAAVAECQAVLATLNARLQTTFGVQLVNRTGVATGDVVVVNAGGGHRVLAGTPLERASSLEPVAPPFEALLDDSTVAAVGDGAVVLEAMQVQLKDGARRDAWRLVHVAQPPVVDSDPPIAIGTSVECATCGDPLGLPAGAVRGWCPHCGAPLSGSVAHRSSRRTLTIVFGDLRPLHAGHDPEAVRLAVVRCFDECRATLERHGATVEKFIGDAVMAVFGLTTRREDDAARAVHAALEMQSIVQRANRERAPGDVELELRVGVNTGPVIAGDPTLGQRLVTGDAVNVAARLEQAARPGDVVIGELTRRLAGTAVSVVQLEPLTLKGKLEPVAAFLASGRAGTGTRGLELPLVGRDRELAALQAAFGAATSPPAAVRVDLRGDIGLGKSRIVHELLDRLPDGVRVLRGACMSYGDDLTFLPVLELLRTAAGVDAADGAAELRAKLAALAGSDDVAARLASLFGLVDQQFPVAESFWAVRAALARVAAAGPVVVVVDGLHWAAPTLLDLLQDLVANLRGVPLLLVTMARPLDNDESTPADTPPWTSIVLEPLDDSAADELMAAALGSGVLPPALSERVKLAAAGNPLFIEQFITMLVDDGRLRARDGGWVVVGDLESVNVPPTVEAVLAARVDGLGEAERGVLEPASVFGREFAARAVAELAVAELAAGGLAAPGVSASGLDTTEALRSLRQRQLVTKARNREALTDHRFRNLLLRDVVYEGLLKLTRAALHEKAAEWLRRTADSAGRLTEMEEVLGFHLEQAHLLRASLGESDEHVQTLGRRAATLLSGAGERAFVRGDMPAAASLLSRATSVLPALDPSRARVLSRVGEARLEAGAFSAAIDAYDEAMKVASATADDVAGAVAELGRTRVKYNIGDGVTASDAVATMRRLQPVFEAAGDHRGLAHCSRLEFNIELTGQRWTAAAAAANLMIEHARAAGDRVMEQRALPALAGAAVFGSTPVPEAMEICRDILVRAGDDRMVRAITSRALAHLLGFDGSFDEARALCVDAKLGLVELGWHFDAALVSMNLGPIEMLAGEPAAAEAALRVDYDALHAMGEQNYVSTTATFLAEAVRRCGRDDEAMDLVAEAVALSADDDVLNQAIWRSTAARVHSSRGRFDDALWLASESVQIALQAEEPSLQADMYLAQAEVLAAAGDTESARAAVGSAAARYDLKQHRVGQQLARTALEMLRG